MANVDLFRAGSPDVENGQGSYWNGYYRAGQAPELPSQFALFVANELATGALPQVSTILDVGCGNGRDSLFFAGLGYSIGGIDRSEDAIAVCNARLAGFTPAANTRTLFQSGAAEGGAVEELAEAFEGPLLVYSRFFFHAVNDACEDRILERVGRLLQQRGGTLAVEFRTVKDQAGLRETGDHYRRYIDTERYIDRLNRHGLQTIWQAQGRGMAKYRGDDAHVARVIAQPW